MTASMKRLARAALFAPGLNGSWGLPLVFWGSPGTAKTTVIREVAREFGLAVEVLSPGERGEGAFGVVPVPDGEFLRYPVPEWTIPFRTHAGLVVVDELTTAPPAIQPALLGLFLERRIGGSYLGPRVRVFGASNPVEEAAAGYDLPAPAANRAGHVLWDAGSVDDWAAHLVGAGSEVEAPLDAAAEEARVLEAWPEAIAVSTGLIVGFLKARPELLHKQPKAGDPTLARAWPSRRTWDFAVRGWASAKVHGLSDGEQLQLACSFVGDAAGTELATFIAKADLPDPVALLDGKIKWEPNPRRLDATAAVLAACTALVMPANSARRADRAKVLAGIFGTVAESAPDVAIPSFRTFVQNRELFKLVMEEARPALRTLSPIMSSAGMMKGTNR